MFRIFFYQNPHFRKFLPNWRFFENIDENQGSSNLLNEIKIFENFDQNWDYLKILTSIEILNFFFLLKSR